MEDRIPPRQCRQPVEDDVLPTALLLKRFIRADRHACLSALVSRIHRISGPRFTQRVFLNTPPASRFPNKAHPQPNKAHRQSKNRHKWRHKCGMHRRSSSWARHSMLLRALHPCRTANFSFLLNVFLIPHKAVLLTSSGDESIEIHNDSENKMQFSAAVTV